LLLLVWWPGSFSSSSFFAATISSSSAAVAAEWRWLACSVTSIFTIISSSTSNGADHNVTTTDRIPVFSDAPTDDHYFHGTPAVDNHNDERQHGHFRGPGQQQRNKQRIP
jgi:hypothetical protein